MVRCRAGSRPVLSSGVSTAGRPDVESLRASWGRQASVTRWLRPLAPLVLAVVVWAAFHTHPSPGLSGRELAISATLGGFVVAGVGTLTTLWRAHVIHLIFLGLLMAASGALVWLQPDGVGAAGVFVGVSLLALRLRGHWTVPVVVVVLVFLSVVLTAGRPVSVTTALLNAIMLSSFYGMTFLAVRLGEANQLAGRLLVEVEQSREAEARAVGLAERQRLAREMHDVLAHSLSGLMLQLEGARMLAAENPADPRLPEVINRAHQLGRSGLDEARRAIGMLRDDELPGPQRLAGLAAQFAQDRDIPCQLTVSGAAHPLDSEVRLALYRVAQEALTNITRHARPSRVELRLAYGEASTRLTVEDFGAAPTGAAPTGAGRPGSAPSGVNGSAGGGYGLTGMRERAELLGGTLTTSATPGGFRVELDVPR